MRDTSKAGEVLSGVGERGATNISRLNLMIDDTDALEDQAREEAITDAKEEAQKLADQLGLEIVRIVSFNEGGGHQNYYDYGESARSLSLDAAGSDFSGPEISLGEETISSTVSITFEVR